MSMIVKADSILEVVKREKEKYPGINFEKIIEKINEFKMIAERSRNSSDPNKDLYRIITERFNGLDISENVKELFYLFNKPKDISKYFANEDFLNLLEIVSTISDYNDLEKYKNEIKNLLSKIKENEDLVDLGPAIITSWMAIYNPKMFMPIAPWLGDIWQEFFTKKLWGHGQWKPEDITNAFLELNNPEFRYKLKELGIHILLEVAYYLKLHAGSNNNVQEANPIISAVAGEHSFLAKYFTSKGYLYPEHLVSQFYVALKTKGFVILSGLTGTGKTKIALEFAELLGKKEKILLPQLLTAWGSDDPEQKFEDAINWIKRLIRENGYAILAWDDSNTLKSTLEPFILWIGYKSGVQYGFIVRKKYLKKEILNNPDLKERIKKGFEWSIRLYEHLEEELKKDKIFLEVTQVIELEKKLGYERFYGLDLGRPLKQVAQKGYSRVRLLDENILKDDFIVTKNHIFLSVRPDWRDSKSLLGYYNPLTGEYHKTQLLEFILRVIQDYEQNKEKATPYFIILDEMNLAHVEYYFADFLSVLESGRDEGFTKEGIPLHDSDEVEKFLEIPKELKLPPNLYIVGTVNMDETTYAFSPKVLDRAFVVEFHDVELEKYPPEVENNKFAPEQVAKLWKSIWDDLRGEDGKFLASYKNSINEAVKKLKDTEYWQILIELNKALEPYDLHFGYRVVDEIALFFKNAKDSEEREIIKFDNDDEIFDLALLMKVLPKFHGNRKKLEKPLKEVLRHCITGTENGKQTIVKVEVDDKEIELKLPDDISKLGSDIIVVIFRKWETYKDNFRFKHTAKKVLRMLRQLYEIGFASFS
ncbi:MAG: 5-methylcytosine-specific restriction enzyme [Thermococcaceae archaeon]|nr:5-methylcytosine-specific restriction enzyme [Thermococcaceae archaeon]